MEPIVKLPKYEVRPVMTLADGTIYDWTWDYYNIAALHERGWTGEGEVVNVIDTGMSDHTDLINSITHVENVVPHESAEDLNGHSTWILGRFIAAHNGRGVSGISPGVEMHVTKSLDAQGSGNASWSLDAVYRAVHNGATVINLSLGIPTHHEGLANACRYAERKGVVVFAAAGNDGKKNDLDSPASDPSTIAVGSHDKHGNASEFSDTGKALDVYGAGDNVLSTSLNNRYANMSGTSMGTPSVAAIFCCIRKPFEKATGVKLTTKNFFKALKYINEEM
jgi:minor extracellular protease Epr